jgi:hypothetical protein
LLIEREKRNMVVSSLNVRVTRSIPGCGKELPEGTSLSMTITTFQGYRSTCMGLWLEVAMLTEVQRELAVKCKLVL